MDRDRMFNRGHGVQARMLRIWRSTQHARSTCHGGAANIQRVVILSNNPPGTKDQKPGRQASPARGRRRVIAPAVIEQTLLPRSIV